MECLKEAIERMRRQLNDRVGKQGEPLSDEQVIRLSEQLDELIVKYIRDLNCKENGKSAYVGRE